MALEKYFEIHTEEVLHTYLSKVGKTLKTNFNVIVKEFNGVSSNLSVYNFLKDPLTTLLQFTFCIIFSSYQ